MAITIACGTFGHLDFSALPEASQKFLAQKAANHQFANVLDAKLAARAESEARKAHGDGFSDLSDEDRKTKIAAVATDAWKASTRATMAAEFIEALKSGTIAVRASAVRLSPEERTRAAVTREWLLAALKAAKHTPPEAKDALQAMLDKYAAKHSAKIEAEVKRRLKASATPTEGDLDGIL